MDDASTTVAALKAIIADFVAERQWQQFHSPKNLAMSLAIEAAELMEHFQWLTLEQSAVVAREAGQKEEIADEMADVLAYLLGMANVLEIDLASALSSKMLKNEAKYPVDKYRGLFGRRDPNAR